MLGLFVECVGAGVEGCFEAERRVIRVPTAEAGFEAGGGFACPAPDVLVRGDSWREVEGVEGEQWKWWDARERRTSGRNLCEGVWGAVGEWGGVVSLVLVSGGVEREVRARSCVARTATHWLMLGEQPRRAQAGALMERGCKNRALLHASASSCAAASARASLRLPRLMRWLSCALSAACVACCTPAWCSQNTAMAMGALLARVLADLRRGRREGRMPSSTCPLR